MAENMTAEELRRLGVERTRQLEREGREAVDLGERGRALPPSRLPAHVEEMRIAEAPWLHVVRAIKVDLGLSDEELDIDVEGGRATGRYGDSVTRYLMVAQELRKHPDLYQPAIIEAIHFLEDLIRGEPEGQALHRLSARGHRPEERRMIEEIIRRHFPDYH